MYLYTNDFIRLDIPDTLKACFEELDKILNKKLKNKIKSDINIDLHYTLGLWIRNNWIYPGHNRIKKILDKVYHADSMSSLIIRGYHYYLNGKNKDVEELVSEEHHFT